MFRSFVPAVLNQKQFCVRVVLHKWRNPLCNILQPLLNNEQLLYTRIFEEGSIL